MFTGIIEKIGKVKSINKEQSNITFEIESDLSSELKIDQSIAHNGVCLTVIDLTTSSYKVTAIDETLKKTNLGKLEIGSLVNLERCMVLNGRLDGHIVQGHVDQVAKCIDKKDENGSFIFTFEYEFIGNVTVEKGSITINGVSLTVFNSSKNKFSVAIIPYTLENTNFKTIEIGTEVNLEFDIIGKYVSKLMNISN
mgnify:CR=1 FL=1